MRTGKILTILGFAAMLFTAVDLTAKTADLGFRIGKVAAAEISSYPVEIIDENKYPYPLPANRIYAVPALKMTSHRSLSSLDYSLILNGKTYPCVAVVCNMASFVCTPVTTFPSGNDVARLLFVIDSRQVKLPAAGKTIRGTLKSNIRGRSNVALNFLSIGNKPFSDCTKIPESGALK